MAQLKEAQTAPKVGAQDDRAARPENQPAVPPATVAVGGSGKTAPPTEPPVPKDVETHMEAEDPFQTPRTNGHRLPGTPHGPELPPSPTTPADEVEPTQVAEPVAADSVITAGGGETCPSVPTTRPVATPVRNVDGVGDESLHASDYTLDPEQDAQLLTLKQDRKHKRMHTSDAPKRFPDDSVPRDPYDLVSPCSPSEFRGSSPKDAQHI